MQTRRLCAQTVILASMQLTSSPVNTSACLYYAHPPPTILLAATYARKKRATFSAWRTALSFAGIVTSPFTPSMSSLPNIAVSWSPVFEWLSKPFLGKIASRKWRLVRLILQDKSLPQYRPSLPEPHFLSSKLLPPSPYRLQASNPKLSGFQ